MGQARHELSHAITRDDHARRLSSNTAIVSFARDAEQGLGINPKTVAKWHKRATVDDLKTGSKAPHSTTLFEAEEAMVVAFRLHMLMPLYDCLYVLQTSIPHLTRSALHRCLQRHGISLLVAYHASRLSDAEIASVRAAGLQPLVPWRRRARLKVVLSRHPRWPQVTDRLEEVIDEIAGAGGCEGQAHLTLSRGILLKSSTHYLSQGLESDQAVAHEMPGSEAIALLFDGRAPVSFAVAVPGERALEVSERRTHESEMSGLVRLILQSWADWLRNRGMYLSSSRVDFGLIFHDVIPARWFIDDAVLEDLLAPRCTADPERR